MLSYSFFILLIFIYNKNMEEKIYKLTQQIDNDLQYNNLSEEEKDKIAKELKPLLPEDAIVLAQTNPTSGDIKGNAKKAFQWIKWAQRLDVDTIVFPEMYLIGYPIGDFIDRFPLIVEENIEWLEAIAQKVKGKTKVIIGFAEFNKEKTGKKYFNSIAVINNGKIERVIRKSLIPNYAEFNDYRHFEPSPVESLNRIIQIGNKKAGIIICEDGWNDFDFFDKNLYSIDPVETVVKEQHPDYLINCSASITRAKKEQLKHNMLGFAAKKHKTPIVYVNQTGSGECMSFEGASRAYDAQGNLVSEEELKNAVAVENGVYTFQLRHMEKIEMTMPYGVEYIVSEEPEDYDVQITKKVSEEEEQKLDNGKKELSDILSENTDLTFTNTKEVQPATGIRQTSAPYMVMTGAAFGMLAFFGLVYGIRKWGDPTGE